MKKKQQPPQHQSSQPGLEAKMQPQPEYLNPRYQGSNKLKNKVAIITGGDSGIGRAIAVHYALEGAKVAIVYLAKEQEDAEKTKLLVEEKGSTCLLLPYDLQQYKNCEAVIKKTIETYGALNILINNAAEQHPQEEVEEISCEQFEQTFKTNIFAYFYMIKAALPYLKSGSVIINTTSITAYKGSKHLVDYSATKGAIVALTRSLSENLIKKGIRVNGVAAGPVWTPLIPASFSAEEVAEFGNQVPMKRAGQPSEIAPSFVFLASDDSSYMSGQILHPNGGVIVNG